VGRASNAFNGFLAPLPMFAAAADTTLRNGERMVVASTEAFDERAVFGLVVGALGLVSGAVGIDARDVFAGVVRFAFLPGTGEVAAIAAATRLGGMVSTINAKKTKMPACDWSRA
jgi:hypothetical protein